jgi:hypothetical protein
MSEQRANVASSTTVDLDVIRGPQKLRLASLDIIGMPVEGLNQPAVVLHPSRAAIIVRNLRESASLMQHANNTRNEERARMCADWLHKLADDIDRFTAITK